MIKVPKSSNNGFTIVELLIVIVVIAILATVSIVAYNGIQARGRASEASYGLTQAKKKLELYKVDNGSYPTTGNLASAGVSDSDVSYQYSSNGTTYCITGTAGNVSYKASDSTNPTAGGCSGHGVGGVAAITNSSVNPSIESSAGAYAGANGATVAPSSTQAQSGTNSLRVTLPTYASASFVGVNISAGYNVPANLKANTLYTMAVWVYVPSATVNLNMSAQGAVASTNCVSGSTAITTKDTWVRATCTFTTSASGTVACYILNGAPSTAGMVFYTDSVMFTEGSTIYNYADGNSADWAWNGSTNNSTSTGPPL
jgi:prepilin-type N-terminal cleavage/methylation domain-containing protein